MQVRPTRERPTAQLFLSLLRNGDEIPSDRKIGRDLRRFRTASLSRLSTRRARRTRAPHQAATLGRGGAGGGLTRQDRRVLDFPGGRSRSSAALPGEHRALEAPLGQVFRADQPVQSPGIAPHHVRGVLAVELGQQQPVARLL